MIALHTFYMKAIRNKISDLEQKAKKSNNIKNKTFRRFRDRNLVFTESEAFEGNILIILCFYVDPNLRGIK